MKFALIFICGLGLGAAITYLSVNQTAAMISDNEVDKNFTQLSEIKVEEIQNLNSSAEQLAQAEAYYGEAVVLFLASLVDRQKTSRTSDVNGQKKNEHESALDTNVLPSRLETMTDTQQNKIPKKESKTKIEKENNARMINFQLSKPFKELTPELKTLNGLYEGPFQIQTGKNKGRIDQMEFEVDLRQEGNKLMGSILCKITDPDGFTYSNSLNTGENVKLKPFKNEIRKIYLEPSPGAFILLDISDPSLLRGEFYEKDGSFKGWIRLAKRN